MKNTRLETMKNSKFQPLTLEQREKLVGGMPAVQTSAAGTYDQEYKLVDGCIPDRKWYSYR